jgi:hypothetical protein
LILGLGRFKIRMILVEKKKDMEKLFVFNNYSYSEPGQ